MIARIWSARATPANWPAYARHFTENVVPELRAVPGYASAKLLKRDAGPEVEITVVTFWQSWAAIDAFAGPDRDAAVVAPHAAALLANYDRRVQHYEVAFTDSASSTPRPSKA
jgi:heme-degrading monooxygenase HmoA